MEKLKQETVDSTESLKAVQLESNGQSGEWKGSVVSSDQWTERKQMTHHDKETKG